MRAAPRGSPTRSCLRSAEELPDETGRRLRHGPYRLVLAHPHRLLGGEAHALIAQPRHPRVDVIHLERDVLDATFVVAQPLGASLRVRYLDQLDARPFAG